MDPESYNNLLLHETLVVLRGTTGVGQPTPGNTQCLCFHSRILQPSPVQKEKDLWKLYSDYGASPRSLFLHAHNPDQYEDFVKTEIGKLSLDELSRLLLNANPTTDNSHYVITTGPLEGNRSRPYRTFTSPYAFEQCCKLILEDDTNALRRHWNLLRGDPTTSTAAGMVFEHRVHQFLQKEKTVTLFPILGHALAQRKNTRKGTIYDNYDATESGKHATQIKLPNLKEHVVIDEAKSCVEYNTYYHPKRKNFPSVDSWVLIKQGFLKPPVFIMFQITINATVHDVKQEGLDLMDKLDIPEGALRWLVVLTPKEARPQIGPVTAEYLKTKEIAQKNKDAGLSSKRKKKTGGAAPNPNMLFPVFHYPVDSQTVF